MKDKEKRVDNVAVQGDYYSRPVPSGDTIIEPKRSTGNLSEAFDFLSRHGAPKKAVQVNEVERATAPNDVNDEKLRKTRAVTPVFSVEASPKLIAERLRIIREEKGLTQMELAIAMGLKSKRAVQNLENARDGVTLKSIRSAMEALEITEI